MRVFTRTVLRGLLLAALVAAGLLAAADEARSQTAPWPAVSLAVAATGFNQPTSVVPSRDGTGRLFVTEKGGTIRVIPPASGQIGLFLDLSAKVSTDGERGLLNIVFPPAAPGAPVAPAETFYVFYSDTAGAITVSRFRVGADPNVAAPASEEVILTIPHGQVNHYGGRLVFGPLDRFLYVSTGDGGAGVDPLTTAQNLGSLLGKILRLDVLSQPTGYAVPANNPFTGTAGALPEIWALGLRNPWGMAFDRSSGELFLADVGLNSLDEVNFQPAVGRGGENYGWPILEGNMCGAGAGCTPPAGYAAPILLSDISGARCALTGGMVYRGSDVPGLAGAYLFADFCTGELQGLRQARGGWETTVLLTAPFSVSAVGEDNQGAPLVVDYDGGRLLRVVPQVP